MKKYIPLILFVLFIPTVAFAHSGGTDSNGGHHDYNNVSGLGSYHYHHGYGPHLHENGICPYDDNSSSTSSVSYASNDSSGEVYTMTETELHDYVVDCVDSDPSEYGMVRESEYIELQRKYDTLEEHSVNKEESSEDMMCGIGITAAIGAGCCYGMYRKYNK